MAANRARDQRRATRRRDRRERAAARDERTEAARPSPYDDALEAAVAELPTNLRAALELRFSQGLTHAEVARTLGVSLRTAKGWSSRALDVLRTRLEGDRR